MSATPAPFCPQCGASLQGSQRFCTNCGATIEIGASSPTVAASQNPSTPQTPGIPAGYGIRSGPPAVDPDTETTPNSTPPNQALSGPAYTGGNDASLPPPPPPPVYNPYTHSMPGRTPNYVPTPKPNYVPTPAPMTAPAQQQAGAYSAVPPYARKPKRGRGCVTASIILLLVLAAGVGGFLLVNKYVLSRFGNSGNQTGSNRNTPTGSGSTPTATSQGNAVNTEQLNLQITYASVKITLISVQQAQKFSDDTSTDPGSAGVVRINLRENNPTSSNGRYLEGDSMLLVLPDGNTIQARQEQTADSPAAGVNRLNWLDFPLNSQVALTQLVLRIGTQSENQMDIPLRPNADLSKYQDKTSNPNAQFKYGVLNMTLKSATLSYSYNNQQATKGNRYVILTIAAVNNSTNNGYITPSSYMRLQEGGNSIPPENGTALFVVEANTSTSGTVTFLVPQDATSFTLVMLAQPNTTPPTNQVTQPFQVA